MMFELAGPLVWPGLTLLAYLAGRAVQRRLGGSALVNPVLIAIGIISGLIIATRTPYSRYFAGAQPIHLLLGPATVALAVPLARNLHHIRKCARAVMLALVAGGATAMVTAVGIVFLLGSPRVIGMTITPKSVTSPIAMGLAEEIGGIPALTTVLVIASGIVASALGPSVFRLLKIKDWRAEGLAAGVAGGGIGSATIAVRNGLAGAFAAVGMGLNGTLTTLLAPLAPLIWK